MSRKVIRIELCPQAENAKDFTLDDWRKLWDDFIEEFDKQELRDTRTRKITSGKTNLAGSMGTVWLHRESRSGIPHLHGAYCRVDENGRCNAAHNIHIRAKKAADAVAVKRGWKTAEQVRFVRLKEARTACEDALKSMNSWSWEAYSRQLAARGFKLNVRKDSMGKVIGYSVKKDNTTYNAAMHILLVVHYFAGRIDAFARGAAAQVAVFNLVTVLKSVTVIFFLVYLHFSRWFYLRFLATAMKQVSWLAWLNENVLLFFSE